MSITWILLALFFLKSVTSRKPQHIIFILADDLGYNDVGYQGSNEVQTPNIDALCYGGIILKQHYVLPMCTPSRAALMTGKYPMHLGMQHLVLHPQEPRGLPLTEKLLPQYLKKFKYVNRILGKWHLGFYKKVYTPLYRGFDSHFGYYGGFQDYYDHTTLSTRYGYRGLDMRRQWTPDWSSYNMYSTHLYTREAENIILNHNTSSPLFLYFSHLAPHAGNYYEPLQAPSETIRKFSYIRNKSRRTYAAMVSELDDSVGVVMDALRKKKMLEDSIVIFLSDNGAPVYGIHANRGSNWPLRGQKNTPFEGGVRAPACVWSKRLKRTRRVSSQLMHISDWLPTLYSAAGGNVNELGEIDGVDMWQALSEDLESPRHEMVINIDEKSPYAALRVGSLKYVVGTTYAGLFDKWFEPYDDDRSGFYDISAVHNSRAAKALESVGVSVPQNIPEVRYRAGIYCGVRSRSDETCYARYQPCLFDLETDPCEYNNLYGRHPSTAFIVSRLQQYSATLIPASNVKLDRRANPKYWNNTWTNWRDYI